MAIQPRIPRTSPLAQIQINSAILRRESARLLLRASTLREELSRATDELVLTRSNAQKLIGEARRLQALRHQLDQNNDASSRFVRSLRFTDCYILDDPELLLESNAHGLACERCYQPERLVAVIRFQALSQVLAICGGCFRQLNELSLGTVV